MKLNFFYLFLTFSLCTQAQFLQKQSNLKSYTGFFDFYYNEAKDQIYLEVTEVDKEFLYVHSLTTGIGSNDIGLDRGQIGDGVIVKFIKAGNKLLLVQPNQRYRAVTENELEKKSVQQAFASSVLFGFPIKEIKKDSYVIDITPFLFQDAHEISQTLKRQKEGAYKIDSSRSALSLERTKAFPENVEFEALVTYKGEPTGKNIRSVTPDPRFITVTQHHSFVKLPDEEYKAREFDPRSGALFMSYLDYGTPIQEPIVKRYIKRHRLEKKHPDQPISEAKEPIIYFLDPGTPEPVLSALLDGAKWWNQAFELAGYKDAFQVQLLPEDVDPMDVRYNMIQWVHRSTRGWSYGASVVDPRTGEIIKGHVSLGSLRIRQDFLIAQALLASPFKNNDNNYQPMLEMALARIRQLSAHEVGHTLGFTHNFAASTKDRASVMDYPHPRITLKDGKIDLTDAYATGIGDWDKVTVAYSYTDFKDKKNESKMLDAILDKAYNDGLRFISDSDARPKGGAHALAHLWDNGKSASKELKNILKVREVAINNFSADNMRSNEPFSVLEDVFVPLYFLHRYQTEAAVKLIGGLNYNYATKGNGQIITALAPSNEQREALSTFLKTIDPQILAIPEEKLSLFPPRAYGFPRSRESFKGKMGVTFDALSVVETASEMSLALLLHPERVNRLIQQKSMNKEQLGFDEVIDEVIKVSFKREPKSSYHKELQYIINHTLLKLLMNLAIEPKVFPQAKAIVFARIMELKRYLGSEKNRKDDIYKDYYLREINRFISKPENFKMQLSPRIPDGSPIGSFQCGF